MELTNIREEEDDTRRYNCTEFCPIGKVRKLGKRGYFGLLGFQGELSNIRERENAG